jgi:hypothetical protein
MKRLFLFAALLFVRTVSAQHNLIPQPVGPLYVENSTFTTLASNNNIFYSGDIVIPKPTTTVTFPQNGPVNVISNHRILVHPGVNIHPSANDRSLLRIAETGMSIAVFSPLQQLNGDLVAFKDEKFEIGLKLPLDLFNAVEAFCNHNTQYPNRVNPFNPEELNVYAVFTRINSNNTGTTYPNVYGFYYREFKRNMSAPLRKDWDWDLDTTSFTFRVRFSPPQTGLWSVHLVVESAAYGNSQTNQIYFNCQPSPNPDNKGYVHTVTNRRYFELGDEIFFPIGENIPGPDAFTYDDFAYGYGQFAWAPNKLAGYLDYELRLNFLSSNGGNFFRMMTFPWTTEIEFEHLNDYSERLYGPWEMDHILDICAEKNLYMSLNLDYFHSTTITSPYTSWFWDWNDDDLQSFSCQYAFGAPPDLGYCYHSELGLQLPEEMLTNPQAKKFYKYRLRYLISRYGYSRNIAIMELPNEADLSFGDREITEVNGNCTVGDPTYSPYETDLTFRLNFAMWNTEMTNYIKNDIYFGNHILTLSYGNPPKSGDASYSNANIDINNFHYYDNYLRINRNRSSFESTYGDNSVFNRPLFFSETGSALILCSDYTEWVRTVWSMPFTGCAGGLNWPGPFPNTSYYHHFSTLKTFLEDVDFNDGEWAPVYMEQSNHLAEALYLKKWDPAHNNCTEAIGVVLNRTFNTYNFADNNTTECHTYFINNTPMDPFENPANPIYSVQDVDPPNNNDDKITLTDMGVFRHFDIEWYNPSDGTYFLTEEKFSTVSGKLYLEYPTLYCSTSFRPIIAYKIREHTSNSNRQANEQSMSIQNKNLLETDSASIPADDAASFYLYPNPATNAVFIHPSTNKLSYSVEIFSVAGEKTMQGEISLSGEKKLNIEFLKPGVYIIKITCTGTIYFLKFIKTE